MTAYNPGVSLCLLLMLSCWSLSIKMWGCNLLKGKICKWKSWVSTRIFKVLHRVQYKKFCILDALILLVSELRGIRFAICFSLWFTTTEQSVRMMIYFKGDSKLIRHVDSMSWQFLSDRINKFWQNTLPQPGPSMLIDLQKSSNSQHNHSTELSQTFRDIPGSSINKREENEEDSSLGRTSSIFYKVSI